MSTTEPARSGRVGIGRALALALVLAFTAADLPAQERPRSEALALSEAVAVALRDNPAIGVAEAGRSAAAAGLREARSGRFPIVTASERLTNGNNPVFVFGTLLEQARFGPENFALDALNAPDPETAFRSSIDVSIPLFDQRRSGTAIEQARLGASGADERRSLVEQQLRLEVLQTYFGVLLAEASKAVVDAAATASEAEVARLRDLFDLGQIVASDVMAVEVQLAEFQQQQIQAESDVATSYAALNTVLGAPPETPRRLSSSIPATAFETGALDELTRAALVSRPDLRELQLELRAREEAVRGAKGEYLPRVDVFATAGNTGDKLVNGSGDYAVGVAVTFNVFDAGRAARVDKARAARDLAEAEVRRRSDAIRFEVVRAYREHEAARGRLAVAERAVAQADETLRIVRERLAVGLTTVTEVLRAESAQVRARTSLISARHANAIGYARVLLATGRLTDVGPFAQ